MDTSQGLVRVSSRRGFTLIELLVVIAIIAVLIGLLLPAIQKVRESANRMKCQNILKQLAIGVRNYETDRKAFPKGDAPSSTTFQNGDNNASWLFLILPFAEQDVLYNEVRASGTLTNAVTQKILPRVLPFGRCPSDGFQLTDGRLCNYVGSSGPQCNFPPGGCPGPYQLNCNGDLSAGSAGTPNALNPPTFPGYGPSANYGDTADTTLLRGMFARGGALVKMKDVTDGTSSTILLGETLPEFLEFQRVGSDWGWPGSNSVSQGQTIQPINYKIDPVPLTFTTFPSPNECTSPPCTNPARCMWNWAVTWGFKSRHPGGTNFAFVDGSVHFVREDINTQLYQYLGCRNDNQIAQLP